MPSVSDVFDELKKVTSGVNRLHNDNGTITERLGESRDELVSANSRLGEISDILSGIAGLQAQSNAALLHITKQADTLICVLEKVSSNSCQMLTEAVWQTAIATATRDHMTMLADIQRSVQSDAALDFDRRQQALQRIEECCPPRQPIPACTYKPCDAPKPFEFQSEKGRKDDKPPR